MSSLYSHSDMCHRLSMRKPLRHGLRLVSLCFSLSFLSLSCSRSAPRLAKNVASPVPSPLALPTASTASSPIHITNFKALIDKPISVIEHPGYLYYKFSFFDASATFKYTLPRGRKFTVGFIQQMDGGIQHNDYKRAFTTWEQPKLPVIDARGDSDELPWYGSTHERVHIVGHGRTEEATVSMEDQPYGGAGWNEPMPPHGTHGIEEKSFPELQHIRRTQYSTVWFIARDDRTGTITVLKRVRWACRIDISVNLRRPIGSRATVNPVPIEKPQIETVTDSNRAEMVVPPQCLKGPTANESDQFWWNPKAGGAGVDETGQGRRVRLWSKSESG